MVGDGMTADERRQSVREFKVRLEHAVNSVSALAERNQTPQDARVAVLQMKTDLEAIGRLVQAKRGPFHEA